MKSAIVEIFECVYCPFFMSESENGEMSYCGQADELLVPNVRYDEIGDIKSISHPIPSWCPQLLDSSTPLTEDNIKDYGFIYLQGINRWISFRHPQCNLGITLCKKTEQGFESGSWYYGL